MLKLSIGLHSTVVTHVHVYVVLVVTLVGSRIRLDYPEDLRASKLSIGPTGVLLAEPFAVGT